MPFRKKETEFEMVKKEKEEHGEDDEDEDVVVVVKEDDIEATENEDEDVVVVESLPSKTTFEPAMVKDPHQASYRILPVVWTRAQFEKGHGNIIRLS